MRTKWLVTLTTAAVLGAVCLAQAEGDKVRTRTEARKGSETALKQQTQTQLRKDCEPTKTQIKLQTRDQKKDGSCQD